MKKKVIFGLGILVVILTLNVKISNKSTQEALSLNELVMTNKAEAETNYRCPIKANTTCLAHAWIYNDCRY